MIKNNSLLSFLLVLLILLAPIAEAETIQIITYTSDGAKKLHAFKRNSNHYHKESLDRINSLLQSIKNQINQEFEIHHLDEAGKQPTRIQGKDDLKQLNEVKDSQKNLQKVENDIDQLQENEGHHKFIREDKLKNNNSTIYLTVRPVSENAEQTHQVLQTQQSIHQISHNQQEQPKYTQKQSELFVIVPTTNTSPQVQTIKKTNDEVNYVSAPTKQAQLSYQLKQDSRNTSTNISEIAVSQQTNSIKSELSSSVSVQPVVNYSEATNLKPSAFTADAINMTNFSTESQNSTIDPYQNVSLNNKPTITGTTSDLTQAAAGSILIDPPMPTSTQQMTVVPYVQNSVLSATSSTVQNQALPVETKLPISSNIGFVGYQSYSNASTSESTIIGSEYNKTSELLNTSNTQQNSLLMPSDILTNQPTQVIYSKVLNLDSLNSNSSLTFGQSICMPMCDYESTAPVCGDEKTCRACLSDSQCINEANLFAVNAKKYSITCDVPTGRCIKKKLNDI